MGKASQALSVKRKENVQRRKNYSLVIQFG